MPVASKRAMLRLTGGIANLTEISVRDSVAPLNNVFFESVSPRKKMRVFHAARADLFHADGVRRVCPGHHHTRLPAGSNDDAGLQAGSVDIVQFLRRYRLRNAQHSCTSRFCLIVNRLGYFSLIGFCWSSILIVSSDFRWQGLPAADILPAVLETPYRLGDHVPRVVQDFTLAKAH